MAVSPTPESWVNDSHNSTEKSENKSSFGRSDIDTWMNILSLLIALAGLVGNGIVLWLLGFRIRRNPFSVYILNLAGADALFLCSSFLLCINEIVRFPSHFIVITLIILRYIFYTVGLSLLAAISTERCLSALFPIWYRCHRPKHTSTSVCAALWALAWMLWLVNFVVWKYVSPQRFNFLIIRGTWLILLTCVMGVSSLTLLLKVQCCSRHRKPPRLYFLVLLTVLVFLLCGLPIGMWGVMDFHADSDYKPSWFQELLAFVNSSVNPFIYFFLGRQRQKRREPLGVVLQRALGDQQELGGATTNNPPTAARRLHSEAKK